MATIPGILFQNGHTHFPLDNPTNLGSILISATTELFERIADKALTVRRITIAANRVVKDEGFFQVDLFTDTTKLENIGHSVHLPAWQDASTQAVRN